MRINPRVHMLKAFCNDGLSYHDAIAELIDNGLDWGATSIVVECTNEHVAVADNGNGADDLAPFVTFGSHNESDEADAAGLYGIGTKSAWLSIGERITIESVNAGVLRRLDLALSQIKVVDGIWTAPDPTAREAKAGEGHGTLVKISQLTRHPPRSNAFERLGITFMPALAEGKEIYVARKNRRERVEACRSPKMTDIVRDSFTVSGLPVEIEIGIIPDGEKKGYSGFLVCYGHRVISNDAIGVKPPYSAAKLGGVIKLGKGWMPTKNKNSLSGDIDDLIDAIHIRIADICEKSFRLSEALESDMMRTEIESLINDSLIGAEREKRNPASNPSGAKQATGNGGKRTNAEKTHPDQPGSVTGGTKRRRHGVTLDWDDFGNDCLGEYRPLSRTIVLNLSNVALVDAKASGNKLAIALAAMSLFTFHACVTDKKSNLLLFGESDFLTAYGKAIDAYAKKERTLENV